jgi:hypothetical protein
MRLFASERAAPEGGQHALAAVTMFFIAPMVMTGRRPLSGGQIGFSHHVGGHRGVVAHPNRSQFELLAFNGAQMKRVMLRAGTFHSSTAGWETKPIGCTRWRPIWSNIGWP